MYWEKALVTIGVFRDVFREGEGPGGALPHPPLAFHEISERKKQSNCYTPVRFSIGELVDCYTLVGFIIGELMDCYTPVGVTFGELVD